MAHFLTMYATKSDAEMGINALALPSPSYSSAKQTASTLVNSGRSAHNGQVYGQRIMDRDLVKIEILWKYLTATQWSDILKKITTSTDADSPGFFVWIKYFDMTSNTFKCRQFYPGDRTATPFRLDPATKAVASWLDCSVNFIDTGAGEATIA